MMSPHIAPARADDGPAIVDLLNACGLPTDGILGHLGTAIVARADRVLVGSAALEVYDEGALLRSVAVAAQARGQGLGQRLTAAALDLAERVHVPAVYLLTTTAENFFPRFGFIRIDRAQVPASVQQSVEFRSACPASAAVMRRVMRDVDRSTA